jgi:4-hydroxy-4-methyl-2-oxoglutarate aldolase
MIGEILGNHVRRRGGVGIVCDGAVRDVAQLAAWTDLAVFARAVNPRGPISLERGEVNVAVTVGGRTVRPGDLLLGDDDGLAALDPAAARTLIAAAEAKLAREAIWLASLAQGRSVAETFGLPPAGHAPEPGG